MEFKNGEWDLEIEWSNERKCWKIQCGGGMTKRGNLHSQGSSTKGMLSP